jgi:hypothetical protein
MSEIDLGQSVRAVLAEAERRQAIYGTLAQSLRAVFPGAAEPIVDARAIEPVRRRRLLKAGKPGPKPRRYRQPGERCVKENNNLGHPDPEIVPRVIAQLRFGAGSVQEIAKALRLGKRAVKKALYHLAGEGRAIVKGRSPGARWSLKPAAPGPQAKETTAAAAAVGASHNQGNKASPSITNLMPRERRLGSGGSTADASLQTQRTLNRDKALLARLKKGPATTKELRAAMPEEPGLTADQYEKALSNALTRLRLKSQISAAENGWALA